MSVQKILRCHVLVSFILIHLAVLGAWSTFSWAGVIAFLVLFQVTGLGITVGFHRMLTHASFEVVRPVRWLLTLAGMTAGQGTPIEWVAVHRKHHAFSDQEDDPHSPHHGGFWWSHCGWLWVHHAPEKTSLYRRYAPDLLNDPFLSFVSRPLVYITWLTMTALLLGAIGYMIDGWRLCWSLIVWGFFVRLVAMYHVTWLVNSATHLWGYRSTETTDKSRNLWWVALFSQGEGWHNNHHAHQTVANHGQRWWEIDVSAGFIRTLAALRLAWNVHWYNVSTQKVEILHRRT